MQAAPRGAFLRREDSKPSFLALHERRYRAAVVTESAELLACGLGPVLARGHAVSDWLRLLVSDSLEHVLRRISFERQRMQHALIPRVDQKSLFIARGL